MSVKDVIAIVVAATGFVLSVYFGLIVMFVGGVNQIVDEINATTASGAAIAWGILRILFSAASFTIGCAISFGLASKIADSA